MNFVTIHTIVDVATALEARALDNVMFMFDNRRAEGSKNQRSNRLCSVLLPGEEILWTIAPLECEVYIAIKDIHFEKNKKFKNTKHLFPGSDVSYWIGTVRPEAVEEAKKAGPLRYRMMLEVGGKITEMTSDQASILLT